MGEKNQNMRNCTFTHVCSVQWFKLHCNKRCTFSICGLEKFDFVVLSSAYKSLTRFALRQKFHVDSIVFLNRCKVFSRYVTLLENKL